MRYSLKPFVNAILLLAVVSIHWIVVLPESQGSDGLVMRYNGPGNGVDEAHALAVDSGGNVYVTGKSAGDGTSFDFATIKYDQ